MALLGLCVPFPLALLPPACFKFVSDLFFRLVDEMLHDWKLCPFSLLFLCHKRMLLYPNFDTEKISGRCSEREICSFQKEISTIGCLLLLFMYGDHNYLCLSQGVHGCFSGQKKALTFSTECGG
jgi:hypothetical protein